MVDKVKNDDGTYSLENGATEPVTGLTRTQATLVTDMIRFEVRAERLRIQTSMKKAMGIT